MSIDADVVLVAIGRRPRTEEMELEKFGVKLDERKRIVVGEHLQTSVKGIYAIGDCISGPMLAHKAEEEGIAVAEHLAGKHGHVNYDVIPGVVCATPPSPTFFGIESLLNFWRFAAGTRTQRWLPSARLRRS